MAEHPERQAERLSSILNDMTAKETPELKLFNYLTDAQGLDGSYRSAWTDVCTALAIETFHTAGFPIDLPWELHEPTGESRGVGGLPTALNYLTDRFATQGRWGIDWFDHARVLRVLADVRANALPAELAGFVKQAHDLLADAWRSDFEPDDVWPTQSEWRGPAMIASASMAFKATGNQTLSAECIARLRSLQDGDGAFSVGSSSDDLLTWHTANSILAFEANSFPDTSEPIKDALNWLRLARRGDDGSWGTGQALNRVDITAYVGRVFHLVAPDAEKETVVRDCHKWLLEQQKLTAEGGKIGPLEGSLHAALFFTVARHVNAKVIVHIPVGTLAEVRACLSELPRRLKTAEDEVDSIKEHLKAADEKLEELKEEEEARKKETAFTVTNRVLGIAGGLFGLMGVLLAILFFLLGTSNSSNGTPDGGAPATVAPATTAPATSATTAAPSAIPGGP